MRCPFATWQGSPNESPGSIAAEPMGVVLHIEQGYEAGTVSVFHNPAYQASAHFGVGKDGHIDQFVDTSDMAWAEMNGNPEWISIEHEGFSGELLTPQQLGSDAQLIAWLKGHDSGPGYNFPLTISDDPSTRGIGWHGMGGASWGGHYDCPGGPIRAQRLQLITQINAVLGQGPSPVPNPNTGGVVDFVGFARTPSGKGYYQCKSDGAVFSEGDARYHGGANEKDGKPIILNKPVVGMAIHPDGLGYWLVASDGGIFTFGDAPFHGSAGNVKLAAPIIGMDATPTGNGYWLFDARGGVLTFGDAAFEGSEFGK